MIKYDLALRGAENGVAAMVTPFFCVHRGSLLSTRLTFEELAVLFEGSTASGAERASRKAAEHMACLLAEAGVLHMIRLKRKSQTKHKKKIAAAVCLYQADNDGEWARFRLILRPERQRSSRWRNGIRR